MNVLGWAIVSFSLFFYVVYQITEWIDRRAQKNGWGPYIPPTRPFYPDTHSNRQARPSVPVNTNARSIKVVSDVFEDEDAA
jgi:hypothetical protein